jgi:hypothetical protein
MTKRLTEHHPLMKRLDELFSVMDKLKISISVSRYDGLIVTDHETKQEYQLLDIEQVSASIIEYIDLPPSSDYKVIQDS